MSFQRRWSAVLLWGVLCAAAVAACARQQGSRFSHVEHLSREHCGGIAQPPCPSCATCHDTKQETMVVAKATCDTCHGPEADVSAERALASLTPANAPPNPAHAIRFNHEKHLSMPEVRGQCLPCHGGVVETGERAFPDMDSCFECHEHQQQWDQNECVPCHAREDLRKTLPQTFLRHEGDFDRRHGMLAGQQAELCQQCHTQKQCDDCHDITQDLTLAQRRPEAIDKQLVHRPGFVNHHHIEARSQPARCMTCHTVETCDSCHVQRGISGNAKGSANPHPPGWVGRNVNAAEFHGRAARRDLVACASCHEQGPATNCIRCHKVGAYGGNPHPRGWKSSRSDGSRMCRYCHER